MPWLVKTEPTAYSFDDLTREGRAVWDGVRNPQAIGNLRKMEAGDLVYVYHSGDDKAVVGTAKVARGAYPDPKVKDGKAVVVDLDAVDPLPVPVTLATLKAESAFAESPLVRQGRLSVVPLTAAQAKLIASLGRGR